MSPRARRRTRLAGLLLLAACSNAGADRVLSIPGTGTIAGQAYFDADGDGAFDGTDVGFPNLAVGLVARGTIDTVARVTSDAGGGFTFTGVPAGRYVVAVDTTTIPGDTVGVTRIDTADLSIAPGEAKTVAVAISYPHVPIRSIGALALGTKVFVAGVALSGVSGGVGIFGDSTVNLADTSGAGRILGVRNAIVAIGDSDRVLGVVQRDPIDNSLRSLAFASLAPIQIGANTPVDTLTAPEAAGANGGSADAALVTLRDTVTVADTATLSGAHGSYLRLHVQDTTGAALLEVRLESIVGFTGIAVAGDTVGGRLSLSGLLVPSGTPGTWVLKPRATTDQH